MTAGISKEEFLKRIKVVLESHKAAAYAETRPSPDVTPGGASSSPIVPSEIQQPAQAGTENPPRNTVSAEGASSRVVQDLLAERSARLEAHKKDQEAEEKTRRIAEAKARKAALEEETPEGSDKSADMKYALMQKKRQQEAREERARILKRVEDDKAERRERDAQRRAQNKTSESLRDSPAAASSSLVPSQLSQSRECALQIRLFDGSTIRSRFSPQGTLRANVRPWIDKEQIIDVPYTFKHILTPLPNKNISISDEEQSLQSQGLTPSATLILVPVHGYTSAYDDSSMTGYMSRGFNLGYGLVSSGVGMVTGVLGSILGGGAAQTSPLAEPTPISNVPASNINVRTLRDQERSEDHQLYNGNAVSSASCTSVQQVDIVS